MNPDEWVPVYQGCFDEDQWNDYQLPVADDWMAFFDYLPEITDIVYINDKDGTSQGVVYFDNVVDITDDLDGVPEVSIDYTIGGTYIDGGGNKAVDVQFVSTVVDPDSNEHDYFWDFGDDSTSTEKDPTHTFLVTDSHPYTVLLQVVDPNKHVGTGQLQYRCRSGKQLFSCYIKFCG